METTPPFGPAVPSNNKLTKKEWTVLATGAIAGLVSCYGILVFSRSHTASVEGIRPYVSAGAFKPSTLYTVDQKGKMEAITVLIAGKNRSVLDSKKLTNGSTLYIVVDSPETFTSNLYKQGADGTLTRLTQTQSAKYNLTVSTDGTHAAFQEAVIQKQEELVTKKDWIITEISLVDASVHSVATGSDPHYIQGGSLAFVRAGGIFTIHSRTQSMASGTEKLKTYESSAIAINGDGSMLAFVNGKTSQIDEYLIKQDGSFSYRSSKAPKGTPINMAYVGNLLYATTFNSKGAESSITIVPVSGTAGSSFTYSNPLSLMPQRIYEHE